MRAKWVLDVVSGAIFGAELSALFYLSVLVPHGLVSALSGRGGPLLELDPMEYGQPFFALMEWYMSTLSRNPQTGIALAAAVGAAVPLVTHGLFASCPKNQSLPEKSVRGEEQYLMP